MPPFRRALILIVAGLTLTACDRLPFVTSPEESAARVCEERLKGSLKSPASYQRLWSNFTPAGPLTNADLIARTEADRLRAIREGDNAEAFSSAFALQCLKNPKAKDCEAMTEFYSQPGPNTAFVLIEYEAVNSFNVKLRGYFNCRVNQAFEGKYADVHIHSAMTVPDHVGRQLKATAEIGKK